MKKLSLHKLVLFTIFIGVIIVLFGQLHTNVLIDGSSMEPTLYPGYVVYSKPATDLTPGKIYLTKEPSSGTLVVKRLIGCPGDTIEFDDGTLYRNGYVFMPELNSGYDNWEVTLGLDEFLFVGDNRTESYDGRYWSRFVHCDEIYYELCYVVYPISAIGEVR